MFKNTYTRRPEHHEDYARPWDPKYKPLEEPKDLFKEAISKKEKGEEVTVINRKKQEEEK